MLTAVLLAGYVALVIALREVITVDLVPELLVTAVIAILALPLREFLQRAIDKMLFGDRRDPTRSCGRSDAASSRPRPRCRVFWPS